MWHRLLSMALRMIQQIIEKLARFVNNNAASLKSLSMDADAP
jgi:hypothetical protein